MTSSSQFGSSLPTARSDHPGANPMSSVATTQIASLRPPGWYEPLAAAETYHTSATANTARPPARNQSPAGGRQWKSASTAVTINSRSTSSSGYASVVTTAAVLPPVSRRTGPTTAAVTD